jgi:hypothetical protein
MNDPGGALKIGAGGDEAGLEGVLENRADALHLVAQRHRAPGLGRCGPQPLEALRGQVIDAARQAEGVANPLAGAVVVGERAGRDLARVE